MAVPARFAAEGTLGRERIPERVVLAVDVPVDRESYVVPCPRCFAGARYAGDLEAYSRVRVLDVDEDGRASCPECRLTIGDLLEALP